MARRIVRAARGAALAVALVAVAPGAAAAAPQLEVYGGVKSASCAWPTTVEINLANNVICSGTLVHPQLVVYAAHCGTAVSTVNFGEDALHPARSVPVDSCAVYPGHQPENGTDWAYCRLTQPITDIPIVPILMGCETAALREGKSVTLVGFGADETGKLGIKRQVTTVQHSIDGAGALIGGNGEDTCQGDSGGPAFVRLDATDGLPGPTDGSWRVYGITSFGPKGQCGVGGHDTLIHLGVPWIEQSSGLDITPCHDADGTWNPGAGCQGFPIDPDSSGLWANACVDGPVSGPSATCGAPYNERAPSVSVVVPGDGSTVSLTAPLQVDVRAVAGSDAIASVTVTYDGQPLPALAATAPDYTFGPLTLSPGSHVLVATAVDAAGRKAVQSTHFEVGADGHIHVDAAVAYATAHAGCTQAPAPLWLWAPLALLWRRRRRAPGAPGA